MHQASWADARRILCVRLDTLGDVLMTEPALRAVKQASPQRHVTLLTSPAGAEVCPLLSAVDDVLCYNAPWYKCAELRASSRPDRQLIARLRARRFDAAVIFTVYSQSALPTAMLCYLADIPLRLAHSRENPYQLLTHWVKDPEPEQLLRHEVRRQLDLVASVGCQLEDERIRVDLPAQEVDEAIAALRQCGVAPGYSWLVVHPGATAASRRYPPELFARACDLLIANTGIQVVFTGTGQERSLVEEIQGRMTQPASSLAGRLTLAQFTGLLSLAPLLISNNTGPVHLAAALGTPVVDLYALTNPQHTPWRVPSRVLWHDVPCKYCYKSICPAGHHDCLRRVTPESVAEAACELLAHPSRTPNSASLLPPAVGPAAPLALT